MGNEKDEIIITAVSDAESQLPSTTTQPTPYHDRPKWLRLILLIIDVCFALSPLLFLGIAFGAIAYNHKRVSDDPVLQRDVTIAVKEVSLFSKHLSYQAGGQAIIDTAQIAVSIFPIIFAALVGRFMKSYALRRAERGSTMGVLEQLYGSQNLSNSVQLLFALRGPGLLGVAVVVVWLLSPLGGQGVKRVLGTTSTQSIGDTTVYYCNTSSINSRSMQSVIHSSTGIGLAPMNDALGALLFTDNSSAASDIFGNVKIPYLTASQATNSGWVNTSSNVTYAAMAGLLVNNLPNGTVTSFNLTTSYVNMVCQDSRTFVYKPFANWVDEHTLNETTDLTGYQDFLRWTGPLLRNESLTNTSSGVLAAGQMYDGWQYLIDVKLAEPSANGGDADIVHPPTFVFANQNNTPTHAEISAYECVASIQWLEAELVCVPKSNSPCSVIRARAASQPASQYGEHPIWDTQALSSAVLDFLNGFEKLEQKTRGIYDSPTALNRYLAGAGTYSSNNNKDWSWSGVTGSDLSLRLGIIVNSAWLVGVQSVDLVQPKPTNVTLLQMSDPTSSDYHPDGLGIPLVDYDVTAALATKVATYQMYQVNWIWVIIAITISVLLLVLGLIGIYFRYTNNHPDVLGFVSTLTRDNPHFDPPPQAEKLGGIEMASYYKHTKVQLVNTANSDDHARITLRQVQG